MMKEKRLKKADLPKLIGEIAKNYKIFGPTRKGDYHVFSPITSADEMDSDYLNSLVSPKGILLPQSEVLYRFHKDTIREEDVPEAGKSVIMFIRPCDARALTFLDKVFGGDEYEDPYYLNRRKNMTVISLACNRPQTTCFCTSVGGGPADEAGSDIIASDLGDAFLLKALNPAGEEFIKAHEKVLGAAGKPDLDKAGKLSKESRKRITAKVPVDGLKEKLDEAFDADVWEKIHLKCLGCGTCTYICSTCYCFDITDESVRGEGARVRSWDSCMYPLFTLHASGHNPRPSGKERMRQRVMHKFNYCPENFGEVFCIGCGRCVRECPVNLDIRKVIENV
jgi:ferredoxin